MDRQRTSWSKTYLCTVLAAGVLVASEPALAQSEPAEPDVSEPSGAEDGQEKPWNMGVPMERRIAARDIFMEANQFMKDTLFAKAAAKYKKALALWDNPAFHYNLAIAQINLDQPIEAYETLKRALRHGELGLGKARHEHTRNYAKLLESQLAWIEVTCHEPGAEVTLDGKPLFTGPDVYKGLVRPGAHQLVAAKSGYLTESESIAVSPGERRRVELALVTLDQASESSRRWATWKPWAVAGGGTALILAGGVLHWRAAADYRAFDDEFVQLPCVTMPDLAAPGCPPGDVPAHIEAPLNRADWQRRLAMASYVAGGATMVTGLALMYFNRPRLAEQQAGRSANLAISPLLTAHGAGMTAAWSF